MISWELKELKDEPQAVNLTWMKHRGIKDDMTDAVVAEEVKV
jgi:hypothetical protein